MGAASQRRRRDALNALRPSRAPYDAIMFSRITLSRSATSIKRSTSLILKYRRVADVTMGLRPRAALGDIGNCMSHPKVRPAAKKSALEADHGHLSVKHGPTEKVVTKSIMRLAAKENVSPPAPNIQPEPSQSEHRSPMPVERCESVPTADIPCQAFSEIHFQSDDPDMEGSSDPNQCSGYMKDIYKYLRYMEENRPVRYQYLAGQEISGDMRAILIDWLVQTHMFFKLQQETLFLTVSIIDRFLQDNVISKIDLQLLGVTALYIASKYEEVVVPCIGDFSCITDQTFSKAHIIQMERKILKALDFFLGCPLPPHFLKRASKIAEVNSEQYVMANYLMELCIVDYDMVHFPPSRIAAAAFCLSLKLLKGHKLLSFLQRYTFYTESDILPVMQHVAKNVVAVQKYDAKQKAIVEKYATAANSNISTTEKLYSPIIWDLAKPLVKKK